MHQVFLEYLINMRTKIFLGNQDRIIFKGKRINSCAFQKIRKGFLYSIYIHIKWQRTNCNCCLIPLIPTPCIYTLCVIYNTSYIITLCVSVSETGIQYTVIITILRVFLKPGFKDKTPFWVIIHVLHHLIEYV